MRVGATQFNFSYSNQLHFPYSIGTVLAAKPDWIPIEIIHCGIEREKWESDVLQFLTCDILLCSVYVWNEQITLETIRRVKSLRPDILIVCGGPQVPDEAQEYLKVNPEIDLVIHGEGEIALWKALSVPRDEWKTIAGLEGLGWIGPERERIQDLSILTSPYLNGTIDVLTKGASPDITWVSTFESTRGCPHSCTFCLAGDTLIVLNDKIARPVDEQYASRAIACCEGGEGAMPSVSVTEPRLVYSGRARCVQVWLSNGLDVTPSLDHRMFVVEGDALVEKPASELRVGDWVPVQIGQNAIQDEYRIPPTSDVNINWYTSRAGRLHPRPAVHPVTLPETLTDELAWILGYFVGDGCVLKNGKTIRFCSPTHQIQEVVDRFYGVFGARIGVYSVGRATDNAKHLDFHSRTLVRFFIDALGLGMRGMDRLHVPPGIFQSPACVVRAFLNGLWAADGYFPAGVNPPVPYLSTISERLAKEVAALIHWIGDAATIARIDGRPYAPNAPYRIQLTHRVGWTHGECKNKDSRGSLRIAEIPLSFGLTQDLRVVPKHWNRRTRGTVKRDRLRRFDPSHPLLDDHLIFVKIERIVDAGEQEVYDVTNPPEGTIAGNGVLMHNCDWSSLTYSKLKQYPIDRIHDEIRWFAKKRVPYIDAADANWGILARDADITRYLAQVMQEENWSTTFRQSWTKNSTDKIIPIAKTMQNAGALTAVGLAVESMDEVTLKVIKRANIKFSSFQQLTKSFRDQGIPTYTEIIRGLPGETLTSFRDGLAALVENSDIQAIYIYNCGVLPNAPMASPAYMAEHHIQTVRSPIYLAHSQPGPLNIQEYENIVIATASATQTDIQEMHVLSWMVILFHSLGLFKYAMEHGEIPPMQFYENLLNNPTPLLASEVQRVRAHIAKGFRGEGWDHVDERYGPIVWPIEEASWLRLVDDPQFHAELPTLLGSQEMADTQIAQWSTREPSEDRFEWAKRVMWFGRRRGAFLKST